MADEKTAVDERLVARRARLQPFCTVEPVNARLRLQSYYQLARQLYRQSEVYFAQSAWDNAYVFLAKFIKLCSQVIPFHQDYKLPKFAKESEWVRTQAKEGFALFDAILDGMEQEEKELLEYECEIECDAVEHSGVVNTLGAPSTATMTLEQRLEALRMRGSAPTTQSAPPPVVSMKEPPPFAAPVPSEPRSAPVAPVRKPAPIVPSSAPRASEVRAAYTRSLPTPSRHEQAKPSKSKAERVSYPSVGNPSWIPTAETSESESSSASARRRPPPASRQRSIDAIEHLSSGKIRMLEIPTSLIAQFTALAAPNTNKPPYGIETCGILAGVLRGQSLVITTLVIPKQEGSSDMCYMTNESELFDFCFSNDLLTLGWIHTHPRQTCFLSSVDIHTQCGFQSILPEAIAIVVAPTDRDRNVGVFRLTEPGGLQLIQNCNLSGFHEHPSNMLIYSDALECDWNRRSTTRLVDMR